MPKTRAVGIDLGTTYSAMAWVDDSGKSALVPNEEGDLLTPSVVLFEDEQVIVGKEAKKVAVMHADRVAICVKRDMGKPAYSRAIRGKFMPPEVIQSYILRKLKSDVAKRIGPDFRPIITVPAYFDEPRRKATFHAGEMAGLNALDILNEPTAAALAFGEDEGYLTRFGAPRERIKVVVYDLGGGTFDVTLIDMQAGDLKTLCTDGDVHLGGYDWDMRLVDYMAGQFAAKNGLDPRQSAETLQRMLATAEEAKHTLSARKKARVCVVHEGRELELTITRDQFDEMTADLLERTRYTTRQLLKTAGMEWKDVSRILLTGGSTRMPMVPKMLKDLTGIDADHSVSPDEAVARGAAVYANYLLASKGDSGHKPTFDITNVNAHSLGIEGTDPRTGRRRNQILIKRNTPLPANKTTECVTKQANQRSVVVQVLEGESLDPAECSAIGRTVIRNLPPNLPKGWPIEVTYEYGVNGVLNVKAKVRGTDKHVELELERDESMTGERLSRWKKVLAGDGGLDAFDLTIQAELEELKKQAVQTPAPRSTALPTGAAQPMASQPLQPTVPAQPSGQPAATPQPIPQPSTPQPVPQPVAPQQQPSPQQPAMQPVLTNNVAFTCPHCRGTFQVSATLAGKQISCPNPNCRGPLIVPAAPRQG